MTESRARIIRGNIERAVQSLSDTNALEVVSLFPSWGELVRGGVTADIGFRFCYGEKLYSLRQNGYTFAEHFVPGEVGTESLFEVVDEVHDGTISDPIPYDGNMVLSMGLYYIQGGAVYKCIRGTDVPVFNALSELVGIYVEVLQNDG